MNTATLNNGKLVVAKDNGDALKYGNRTAAESKLAKVLPVRPDARVYQAVSPARGFYIELDWNPEPVRTEVKHKPRGTFRLPSWASLP